ESVVGSEDIAEVHRGVPSLPLTGIPEGDSGPPVEHLSPPLAEALTAAWPELQQMLEWWPARRQQQHEPTEKLERVTYHVAPRWIAAVKREADLTGESYAAIVNRALAQYFAGKGFIPTVCLDVISLVAGSCRYNRGAIEPRVAH